MRVEAWGLLEMQFSFWMLMTSYSLECDQSSTAAF
jgi:hypothetical protein